MDIEARLAVTSLMGRYANAIDHGESSSWTGTFTEDGVFRVFARDLETPVISVQGQAELAGFMESMPPHNGELTVMSNHMFGAIEFVSESADEIRLRTRAAIFRMRDGEVGPPTNGTYVDVVQRENGEWRFAERVLEMDGAAIAARPGS
jgi:3-phenylpropionate/cinnamic acid dioxygenase small subunit